MHDVSIPAAILAGLISFLSPCVLPLVPPYLIYLTGATIEHVANEAGASASKRAVMGAALMFVLGFSTIFVTLGATASFVGRGLRELRVAYLHKIAEIQAALGFRFPFPDDPFAFLAG